MLIFLENNKNKIYKGNKNTFGFLGPTRIDLNPTYPHSK